MENSLRGRPLNGINIKLGQNHMIGLVINETHKKNIKGRELELESKFDQIYSWRLDEPKINVHTDLLNKAMRDWFSASKIVRVILIYFNYTILVFPNFRKSIVWELCQAISTGKVEGRLRESWERRHS